MKKIVSSLAAFGAAFAIGFSVILTLPAPATADGGGPSPCTSLCGTDVVCGTAGSAGCAWYEQPQYRCKQWNPPLAECDGPFSCGCVFLGCGPLCNDD